RVLAAHGHETGHLLLGERDLLAAPFREGEVGHAVLQATLAGGGIHGGGHLVSFSRLTLDRSLMPTTFAGGPATASSRAGPLACASGGSGRTLTSRNPACSISRRSSAPSKPSRHCPISRRKSSRSCRSRSTITSRPPARRIRRASARAAAGSS